jgi:hypothetical protein
LWAIAGCNTPEPKQESSPEPLISKDTTPPPPPENKDLTELSLLLAGMQGNESHPLSGIRKDSAWMAFSAVFDSSWKSVSGTRYRLMKKWSSEELQTANASDRSIFYPFGGPDFLNAFTLFPNAKEYNLFGLEPVGNLPEPEKMLPAMRASYFFSIRNALRDILFKSYFISRNMMVDLKADKINGTLPLLAVFLARTGNKILSIKHVVIDSSGSIQETDPKAITSNTLNPGVKIEFIPEGKNEIRTLTYFKADLSDFALLRNKGMVAYAKSKGTVNTYLKSASYLLHYKEFSVIRNIILDQSAFLLQDDSGIAYRYFDTLKWDFKFYGYYTDPVKDFSGVTQEDLRKIYTDNQATIQQVPFILGYHWGSKGINLMRAIKK